MSATDAGESPGVLRAAIAVVLIDFAHAESQWQFMNEERSWPRPDPESFADRILALSELGTALAGRTQGEPECRHGQVGWVAWRPDGTGHWFATKAEALAWQSASLAPAPWRSDLTDEQVMEQMRQNWAVSSPAPATPAGPERIHYAVGGIEHDPARSLFHGCCAACGVAWPCSFALPDDYPAQALAELTAALAGRTQGEPVGWLVEFEPGRFVFADTEAEPIVYLYREEAEMSADEQRGCSSPWPGIRIVPLYRASPAPATPAGGTMKTRETIIFYLLNIATLSEEDAERHADGLSAYLHKQGISLQDTQPAVPLRR